MTPAEVYALAIDAGLDSDSAVIAVAIAWAESGLDPDAIGDEGLAGKVWGPSIGIWQIRSLRADTATGRVRDAQRLSDPAFNARAMVTISAGGTNWTPWSVYKSGRYRQHLDAVRAAVKEPTTTEHRIIPRSEWGAKPASGMAEADYPMSALWLHHSDTVATDDPAADMRLLQLIGKQRGFADVSYTFGLHPDGSILEGRELRCVGAHTFGQNSTSLAFVLIGTYTATPPTAAQIASARWLRDHLIAGGYLTPGTYPTGGHQDAPDNQTSCPGAAAESRLDLFRAPQAGGPEPAPDPDPVPQEEDDAMRLIGVTNNRGIFMVGGQPLATGKGKGKVPAVYIGTPEEVDQLDAAGAAKRDASLPDLPEAVFDRRFVVVG